MIAAPIHEGGAVIATIRSLRTCGATAAACGLVRVTTAFGSDCPALQVLDGVPIACRDTRSLTVPNRRAGTGRLRLPASAPQRSLEPLTRPEASRPSRASGYGRKPRRLAGDQRPGGAGKGPVCCSLARRRRQRSTRPSSGCQFGRSGCGLGPSPGPAEGHPTILLAGSCHPCRSTTRACQRARAAAPAPPQPPEVGLGRAGWGQTRVGAAAGAAGPAAAGRGDPHWHAVGIGGLD